MRALWRRPTDMLTWTVRGLIAVFIIGAIELVILFMIALYRVIT